MDGAYGIATDQIRTLAHRCHELDVQFDRLFVEGSVRSYSDRTYQTYNHLLATSLLNLAISIHVALNAEPEYVRRDGALGASAALDIGGLPGNGSFSVKDLCDRVIQADDIFKPVEPETGHAGCRVIGSFRRQQWELGLGVQGLTDYVLTWLDEIDRRRGQ
ncbi:MAG: hypothetical protein H6843_06210 [Rhodospirillaceae bacterium]|nr:hypothetical protein [Rhodospirillaceae bacterium]